MGRKLERLLRISGVLVILAGILALAIPVASAQEAAVAQEPVISVDLGFGSGIDRETRALTGEGTVFPSDTDRVYCRMHITGAAAPTTVTHAWYRDGKTMAEVELNVGSSSWRTWSSKRLLPDWTGFWEVKVLDQTGKVLASASFEVK